MREVRGASPDPASLEPSPEERASPPSQSPRARGEQRSAPEAAPGFTLTTGARPELEARLAGASVEQL